MIGEDVRSKGEVLCSHQSAKVPNSQKSKYDFNADRESDTRRSYPKRGAMCIEWELELELELLTACPANLNLVKRKLIALLAKLEIAISI